MIKLFKFIPALLVLLMLPHVERHLCDGFIPANDFHIPKEATSGISEEQFNTVLIKFKSMYAPIVSQHGADLVLRSLWSNTTVNSDTTVSGSDWIINAYGGLARYKGMTPDAYTLVLCHEVGHHLAGFPRVISWASNEGQSDYFSTMKCARKMFRDSGIRRIGVPSRIEQACQGSGVCERSMVAGLQLAGVLADLGGEGAVSVDSPSTAIVTRTYNNHPAAQCRFDTYFNGAVCPVSSDIEFSTTEPKQGACSEEAGETRGVRPHCWYKPGMGAVSGDLGTFVGSRW